MSSDWLGLDNDEPVKQANFEKTFFEGSNKGKLLFELQKSYKGDDRFVLDKRFAKDFDASKLPNTIKQSNQAYLNQSNFFSPSPSSSQPVPSSLTDEKNNQKKILRDLFPEDRSLKVDLPIRKIKIEKDKLIIPRFDPKNERTKGLILKKEETKKKQLNEKDKEESNLIIHSGVDKKKMKIMKANKILEEKLKISPKKELPKPKKAIKKIINYSAWKKIIKGGGGEKKLTLFG